MTQQRRDDKSTEFGIWLRHQAEIDSGLGFVTSNIDYVWHNYKTGLWMILEEKRHRYMPKWYQTDMYRLVDDACRLAPNYRGFHVIIFENTSPDDGAVWLDGEYISAADFVAFLQFEQEPTYYTSYFPERGVVRIGAPAGCVRSR